MGPDFYAILGVSPGSDAVVIRAAYKALMFKFHPDRNRTPEAERRARAINEAFTVLGDARRRAAYDSHRAAEARARSAPPPRPGPPPRQTAWSQGGPPARAPWRRLALLRVPHWITRRRVATAGGALSLAVAVHLATIAFAPAGLFVSASPARASTGDTAGSDGSTDGAVPNMPAPDIAFTDVESGAGGFTRAFQDGGMAAARIASQRCHAEIAERPSWRAADRCAAFDLAANAYDEAVSESRGDRGDTYFLFAGRNPTALYHDLSSDELTLEMRTTRIVQAVLPALQQAMWPSGRRVAGRDAPAGPRPGYWSGKREQP